MKSTVWRLLVVLMLAIGSLTLIACGEGMSGKYGNEAMQVEFKSSSTAHVTVGGGMTIEVKYEVDGDKIILHNQAGNLVLTRNKDGTLGGSPGGSIVGPMKKLI